MSESEKNMFLRHSGAQKRFEQIASPWFQAADCRCSDRGSLNLPPCTLSGEDNIQRDYLWSSWANILLTDVEKDKPSQICISFPDFKKNMLNNLCRSCETFSIHRHYHVVTVYYQWWNENHQMLWRTHLCVFTDQPWHPLEPHRPWSHDVKNVNERLRHR